MQGIRRDNSAAWPDEPVVGYDIPTLLGTVLPALDYLHQLRGFEMADSVYEELEYYVSVVLHNKARCWRAPSAIRQHVHGGQHLRRKATSGSCSRRLGR